MEPEISRRARLLVVEDEADLCSSLEYALKASGYDVQVAERGDKALRLLDEFAPDLVLLDVMLPDMSGLDICRRIRQMPAATRAAVIILSARVEESDRVAGLEAGADDYVVKPFNVRELVLRIEARLKARHVWVERDTEDPPWKAEYLTVGNLAVDEKSHRAFVGGREVHVSALEMRLILHLMRAPGRMCTRRDLLTEVWGYHPEVSSRTVDTHVKRLRDKLGEAADLLQTVRGIGFRLAETNGRGADGASEGRKNERAVEGDRTSAAKARNSRDVVTKG
jgi:two-component system, OmpR family, phosphate regulon response regulator PhoB